MPPKDHVLTDSMLLSVAERRDFSDDFTWMNFKLIDTQTSSWAASAESIMCSTVFSAYDKAKFILYILIILLALKKNYEATEFKSVIISENISEATLKEALQIVLTRFSEDIKEVYNYYTNFIDV